MCTEISCLQFWGFCSGAVEDSDLKACDVASVGNRSSLYRGNVASSSWSVEMSTVIVHGFESRDPIMHWSRVISHKQESKVALAERNMRFLNFVTVVANFLSFFDFNVVNQQFLYLLSVLTKQSPTRKSTDENLFQLIALVYIKIKVVLTCFGWYTQPSWGSAHKGYILCSCARAS
jgi:hypothetical protein